MSTLSESAAPRASAVAPTVYSPARSGWMLLLLALVYANNFADRSILGILAQPIKLELNLTDTELGLMSGLAFAVFYALFGYPLARLSERVGRVNIISICIALWSAMAALCGAAAGFTQLVMYRFGVGVGESGLTAPAHALIADYFPPAKRTSAISIFTSGYAVGSLVGAVAGGWLAQHYGWRVAFIGVGLPGLLLAPLLKLTVKEPARGNFDASRLAGSPLPATPPLAVVLRRQFATPTYRHFCMGAVLVMFVSSNAAFVGAYYVRRFHIDYTTVGLLLGLLSGGASLIGVGASGFLTDWLSRFGQVWYARLPAIAVGLSAPLAILGYLQSDWRAQVAIALVASLLASVASVPFYGLTQNLLPARMRATGAAVMMFLINLLGLGIGPVLIGAVIDALTHSLFASRGLGAYAAVCGKGGAHVLVAGAGPACGHALAEATRWTLAATNLCLLWAAAHFLIAGRTIARDLTHATQTN